MGLWERGKAALGLAPTLEEIAASEERAAASAIKSAQSAKDRLAIEIAHTAELEKQERARKEIERLEEEQFDKFKKWNDANEEARKAKAQKRLEDEVEFDNFVRRGLQERAENAKEEAKAQRERLRDLKREQEKAFGRANMPQGIGTGTSLQSYLLMAWMARQRENN
jgi:hypothetical protein